MVGKKLKQKLIDLLWELLLHEMGSFRDKLLLHISNILFHLPTLYVLFNPWKFQKIVLSANNQQHRNFNLRLGYGEIVTQSSETTEFPNSNIVRSIERK